MEIKVQNIKTHTYNKSVFNVVEAGLILLACKSEEALLVSTSEGSGLLVSNNKTQFINPNHIYYKPILVSLTEKIEEDDWFFHADGYEQAKVIGGRFVNGFILEYCFKILVLPEHFSPKHLQDIADGKLKGGDTVLVECMQKEIELCVNCNKPIYQEFSRYNGRWFHVESHSSACGFKKFAFPIIHNIIKLNSSNHITFYKKEERTYTQSEVDRIVATESWKAVVQISRDSKKKDEVSLGIGDGSGNHYVYGSYETIKLLQQKLLKMEKMYTREEVKVLMEKLVNASSTGMIYFNRYDNGDGHIDEDGPYLEPNAFNKWFEDNI